MGKKSFYVKPIDVPMYVTHKNLVLTLTIKIKQQSFVDFNCKCTVTYLDLQNIKHVINEVVNRKKILRKT